MDRFLSSCGKPEDIGLSEQWIRVDKAKEITAMALKDMHKACLTSILEMRELSEKMFNDSKIIVRECLDTKLTKKHRKRLLKLIGG